MVPGYVYCRWWARSRRAPFMSLDGVLSYRVIHLLFRFYCRADLPKYALGESGEKEFAIHFYLADDTLEVRELRYYSNMMSS